MGWQLSRPVSTYDAGLRKRSMVGVDERAPRHDVNAITVSPFFITRSFPLVDGQSDGCDHLADTRLNFNKKLGSIVVKRCDVPPQKLPLRSVPTNTFREILMAARERAAR